MLALLLRAKGAFFLHRRLIVCFELGIDLRTLGRLVAVILGLRNNAD